MKKNFIFIGNRPLIIRYLIDDDRVKLKKIFLPIGTSFFDSEFSDVEVTFFDSENYGEIIEYCRDADFDVCVSAGCPIILPRSTFPTQKIFINSHPSALPYGKGIHPINECILSSHKKMGSTLHYLVDKLDAGDIISQETFEVTDEVDLSLLYSFIFQLEKEVFVSGLNLLFESDFDYIGTKQTFGGTYYSRKPEHMVCDSSATDVKEIIRKIKAFSSKNLGVKILVGDEVFYAYKADEIRNEYILSRFSNCRSGSLAFKNNDFVLIKCSNGLIRLIDWN